MGGPLVSLRAARPWALWSALACSALAGGGPAPAAVSGPAVGPAPLTAKRVTYVCAHGEAVRVSYLSAGQGAALFALLTWNGQTYGLARATSASGARYAALAGPTPAGSGLEWWEAGGTARLSALTGRNFFDTRPLLSGCRPR